MDKTAVIVGGTGLVGKALVNKLSADPYFSHISSLVRYRSIELRKNVREEVIDFNSIKHLPSADILFICLGTTRRKAGSKEGFRKVDYGYVTTLARLAEDANYEKIIVVSSYGANASSKNFYLRVKGQMEDIIQTINVPAKAIIRPSLLLGKRKEFRLLEWIAGDFMKLIAPLLGGKLLKYKPVYDTQVANAIIKVAKETFQGTRTIEPDQIHHMS